MQERDLTPRIWNIIEEHLANATPWEWHLYADGSNHSDNRSGLEWLLDQPELELATALR
ncbi:hypothetical protein SJI00_11000 [Pseudomonas sp. RP23018S]|uniref:hypothetical protein n=1 Tax=Pseudomonas sp. RP23018S TaxID=3096037 RepID=UPI002ACA4B44|nr:hypothetical protein [Pseudomonas sp. RP23018S]MDZ5603297.1 hypothetical protein [Pseudomonas sp. RP23018S]